MRMRIVISVVLALAFVVVLWNPASGDSPPSVVYENEEYGFSLTLPQGFAEGTTVREEDGAIYFVNTDIQRTNPESPYGVVGRIEVFPKAETTLVDLKEREEIYNLKYLGENRTYYFGWAHATDVQVPFDASEAAKNDFSSMEAIFGTSIQTFQITE